MSGLSQGTTPLTPAQRGLLERLSEAEYGELYLRGADLRGIIHPNFKGLVESTGAHWYRITGAGRRALDE